MDKEALRKDFAAFTTKYALIPHKDVGVVSFRGGQMDFLEAFKLLAAEFKSAEGSRAKAVLDEAYKFFEDSMHPHAIRKIKNHAPDPQFWLALRFLKIRIEFTNGMSIGPDKTETELSYEEMFDWCVGTSSSYRELQAPWTVADVRDYLNNFGGEYNWSRQKASSSQSLNAH